MILRIDYNIVNMREMLPTPLSPPRRGLSTWWHKNQSLLIPLPGGVRGGFLHLNKFILIYNYKNNFIIINIVIHLAYE